MSYIHTSIRQPQLKPDTKNKSTVKRINSKCHYVKKRVFWTPLGRRGSYVRSNTAFHKLTRLHTKKKRIKQPSQPADRQYTHKKKWPVHKINHEKNSSR